MTAQHQFSWLEMSLGTSLVPYELLDRSLWDNMVNANCGTEKWSIKDSTKIFLRCINIFKTSVLKYLQGFQPDK